ncbi:MAG: hypothetical protein OMM_12514 [Candidatus Magnetoglobus multicellularis str. Araruama]|uniref:Uncharacterized protein n=1 Tax=Candidatus Magnetoglobus multicellularis str. Araruama TaxID=890399 RepID=A0A1V1NVS1_9BACT|nr:MAG: hypothetical protein OMM_12514 [Candidatus Magnetoglobus multicellularis str. Araruama]
MIYWLVRAKWDMVDKINDFLHNNEWINGYESDNYCNEVNSIQKGDLLILVDGSYTIYYGKCSENLKDGITVKIDQWIEINPIFIAEKGAYRKSISKISNAKLKKKLMKLFLKH